MRGNPPLHLTLALIGFMLLAIPLAKLTFARTDSKASVSAAATETVKVAGCLLRVRFVMPPKQLSITRAAKVILELKAADTKSPIEQTVRLDIPKDGLELNISAEWPVGAADQALTVELEPDGLDTRSVTRWSGSARINEVVSFTW